MDGQPHQNPSAISNAVSFYGFCQECLQFCCNQLYATPYLLIAQLVLSLGFAEFCGWMTRAQSPKLQIALGLGSAFTVFYLAALSLAIKHMEEVKDWCKDLVTAYWLFYKALRILVIIALIRLFVLVAALLENEQDLDGYSVGFFLLAYLHIVSLCKLFNIEDFICLSDSILGIAIFIAARLDHFHGTEELCHPSLSNTTATFATHAPTSPLSINAGYVGRAIASYVSAFLLAFFRFSKLPVEAPAPAPIAPVQNVAEDVEDPRGPVENVVEVSAEDPAVIIS